MKYPIDEEQLCNKYQAIIRRPVNEEDREFMRGIAQVINHAYNAGYRKGVKDHEDSYFDSNTQTVYEV